MELALSWQDIALTVGNLALLVAMVPEFAGKPKLPLATSIPAACALFLFTIAYATVGLWSAAVSSGLITTGWVILMLDHPRFNKVSKRKRK